MSKPAKYSTEELIDIIISYQKSAARRNKKLIFSDIAKYAKEELKYKDIRYYHFSRNKEINDMVNKYNEEIEKKSIVFIGEENTFLSLNIEEFVKMNIGNEKKLRLNMSLIQESFENLYNAKIKLDEQNKILKNELDEKSENILKYKEKSKKLKEEVDILKEQNKMLKLALGEEEEKQMMSALKSTKIYPIEILNKEDERDEDIYKPTEDNGKNIKNLINQLDYDTIFEGLDLDE